MMEVQSLLPSLVSEGARLSCAVSSVNDAIMDSTLRSGNLVGLGREECQRDV